MKTLKTISIKVPKITKTLSRMSPTSSFIGWVSFFLVMSGMPYSFVFCGRR